MITSTKILISIVLASQNIHYAMLSFISTNIGKITYDYHLCCKIKRAILILLTEINSEVDIKPI